MDVGTAKPLPVERNRVRHHLVDELDPGTTYSAGEFARRAEILIDEISSNGHIPIVVGGSTLYLHALRNGLAKTPPVDRDIRSALSSKLENDGLQSLTEELKRIDPLIYSKIDRNNPRRIVRALEVFHASGRPLSSIQLSNLEPKFKYIVIVLYRGRKELYDMINERVNTMLTNGLLKEVQLLLDRGYDENTYPLKTIGYQEPLSYFKGVHSFEEMVALIKIHSRRYAKRQLTWFRRNPTNIWACASISADSIIKSYIINLAT